MTFEENRIAELKKYNVLDTLTEQDYEDITFLASVIFDVPIALISFVDSDRQWFKSHRGLPASETLREYSFCAHAINKTSEVMIVEDSRIDERFKDNPLVTGDPEIVFYAGAPLINEEGFGLGTVCIIDTKVRKLTDDQIKSLQALSNQVMTLLKIRKTNLELESLKLQLEARNMDLEQFAMVVSHDIKSPLTTIILANKIISDKYGEKLGDDFSKLLSRSSNSVNKIKSLVDGILSYYKNQANVNSHDRIDVGSFFESLNRSIDFPEKVIISYTNDIEFIEFDRSQLEQIFSNLINNSIRYNHNEVVQISIGLTEDKDFYKFFFEDNGMGIAKENHEKVFDLFTTVSPFDNAGLKGSGIGLPTIKKIIENARGTISISSGLGAGTSFTFTLKK